MAFWISFGDKSSWTVAVLTCRRFGCIQNGDMHRFGMSPFWPAAVWICRRFGCRRFGFVAVLTCIPSKPTREVNMETGALFVLIVSTLVPLFILPVCFRLFY